MVNEEQQEYRATGTEFKHEDTTQVMRIRFIAGNRFPIYPTKDHKFVAKIGKAYGSYIGDYPVSVSGNSFEVKSSDLKGLDNGDYRLEIWESYIDSEGNTQTGIFPSPRAFVSFTINQNIEDTAWNLVKDISFQDIVNTAVVAAGQNIVVAGTNTLPAGSQASVVQKYEDGKNEFTFNIPQGIQGPAGPAATIHVTKTYTVPAGQPPVFKEIPKGDGNFDVEIGLPQGVAGKDGHSVWENVTNHGPNGAHCWFTDLAGASASNPPKVNDIVINADGNMAMITKVDITNSQSTGGGMFDYGPWVGNIKGSKGDQGNPGKDGYTPVRGTDYWTAADQKAIKDDVAKMAGAFTDHGTVSAGSANDLIEAGMYSVQNNVTDMPDDVPWGMLVVFTSNKADKHYVKQDFSVSKGGIFSRLGVKVNNRDITWGPWNKLGGVINLTLTALPLRLEVAA